MRQRLSALALCLLLLLTQQLGLQHLLSHGLQPGATATLAAGAEAGHHGHHAHHGDDGDHGDVGDALCQVCLALAALGAAGLPVAWGWLARQVRNAAPQAVARPAPRPRAAAPWQARAPPSPLH